MSGSFRFGGCEEGVVSLKNDHFEHKVEQVIQQKQLLGLGDSIVVAVSGGPDSVALLMCLEALHSRWKWKIVVGHINHGFRGEEGEKDAAFVEGLASSLGLPCTVVRLGLNKHDSQFRNRSVQEIARTRRYEALHKIVQDIGATKLVLGHTENDQAETVLMWMLRGSGTGGMGGIPQKSGEMVVRPLLDVSRGAIQAYLQERQITYRMDSSNLEPYYLRNRIRQELLPTLQTFTPGIVKVLSRQARIIREDHAYLESVAHEHFETMKEILQDGAIRLKVQPLLALPLSLSRRVVRMGLQHLSGVTQGPRFDVIQGVLDRLTYGQSGWSSTIYGIGVTQEYEYIVFRPEGHLVSTQFSLDLPGLEPGISEDLTWPLTGERLTLWFESHQKGRPVEKRQKQVYCDAETFTHDLRWRTWEAGDMFYPQGMGGKKKKLQDFFSDVKLPRSLRKKVPLLVAPEGIMWVAGFRADERFQVTSRTTSILAAKIS